MIQSASIAVTRTVSNDAVSQLLSGNASPGEFDLFIKASGAGVYVGGLDMPIGSDFPAGGISPAGGFAGYELTSGQEYHLRIFETPQQPFALNATTVSADPVVVAIWAVPRVAPGS